MRIAIDFAMYGLIVVSAFWWAGIVVTIYVRWRAKKYGKKSWM